MRIPSDSLSHTIILLSLSTDIRCSPKGSSMCTSFLWPSYLCTSCNKRWTITVKLALFTHSLIWPISPSWQSMLFFKTSNNIHSQLRNIEYMYIGTRKVQMLAKQDYVSWEIKIVWIVCVILYYVLATCCKLIYYDLKLFLQTIFFNITILMMSRNW